MANPNRLKPAMIDADMQAQDAIKEMADFAPGNKSHQHAELDKLKKRMLDARAAEEAADRAAAAARDEAVAREREYHDAVTGAKTAVKAQYGKDSNELQAVGLKKSSERKRPAARQPAAKKV